MWHDALVSLTTKRAKLGIVRYTKKICSPSSG